jgi:glycosyltransferase involved in cell wall biosynthesis
MRGNGELSAWGRESLAGAKAVIVGSEHIRKVLDEVVGQVERVHIVPPGVAVDEFEPLPREVALGGLLAESRADPPNPGNRNERLPDEGNAERMEAFFAEQRPTVLYFGKLLHNKGVHVLFEALRDVDAQAVVVGFGDHREELERLAPPGTLFTGALEHRHLSKLIPLTDVTVVPSIFPEAFGMVAAEAAAAGSLPLVAHHSGLAEIAAGIAAEYPDPHKDLVSFATGDAADLGAKLNRLFALDPAERAELAAAARRAVVDRWSWASVARRLLEPFQ